MAHKRPIASDVPPSSRPDDAIRHRAAGALSRAEARALTRCAPLTAVEFKAQRELADKRVFPPTARLGESVAEPPQEARE